MVIFVFTDVKIPVGSVIAERIASLTDLDQDARKGR